MKKHLLIAAGLFTSAFSFSQFTQGDEPSIGDVATLYVIDSMAPDYSGVTGAGVEWDYSSYEGYVGGSRGLEVLDPTTTAFAYPSATAAIDIQDFLKTFTSSTATQRVGHGFVYTDAQFGDIVVKFNTDQATLYEYPFALGETFTDAFEGTATYNLGVGGPTTSPAAGELTATVDGEGTLKLADAITHTNVLRYKLKDSTVISTGFADVTLKRTQYEYYDFASGELPVFVHTHLEISGPFTTEFDLVMSSVEPTTTMGVEENILSNAVVYPNPATDVVNISLSNELSNTEVSIVDAMGRVVLNQSIENDFVSLDVAGLEGGIYFVKISNGEAVETKTVVIK
jgi:hypothetical protein